MEQITYLLFIRRLDDLHTAAENKANRLGQPIENAVYRKSEDQLRWSRLKNADPSLMYQTVGSRCSRSCAVSASMARRTPST